MTDNILSVSGIYAITNLINGKCYIGQSANIKERSWQHWKELKKGNHHCKPLQRAYNKYGRDNLEHKVIEICDKEIITIREQYWMDFYKKTGIYNTCLAAGSPLGIKRDPATVERIASTKRGKKASEETRAKMRESQARIKNLKSSASKKQWSDPVAIKAISEKRKGRITSEKTKEKLSEGLKIRWSNPEYKRRLSKIQGIAQRKVSQKQSERMKENWSDPEYRKKMIAANVGNKL